MKSILIITDDAGSINQLLDLLINHKYTVAIAHTFNEALIILTEKHFNVILFDVKKSNFIYIDLIKKLKQKQIQSSIIVTSFETSLEKKIFAIETGADDYITKPYYHEELLVRIKSQIRRNRYNGCNNLTYNEIDIEIDNRKVLIKKQQAILTAKEFDLLIYFVLNAGKALHKETLMSNVWKDYDDNIVSNDTIYTHIKNLRKKLALFGSKDYLKSIYKFGYQWQDS